MAASISYRLGPIAVLPPIDTQLERQIIDNARADMQTAVRWFRTNAATLGVDADKIAVAGVSAGAVTALGVAHRRRRAAARRSPRCLVRRVHRSLDLGRQRCRPLSGADDAGALFFHGSIDAIVPYPQAAATRDAMIAAGLAVQWIEFDGEGHSLTDAARASMVDPTVALAVRPGGDGVVPVLTRSRR